MLPSHWSALLSTPTNTPLGLAIAVCAAALAGAVLALAYRLAEGAQADSGIARAQIGLAALMAVVMAVVGDHLSRAFGAAAILGVMRLRLKMKGPADALALLGAVAAGMAAGVGMFREALLAAALLGLISLTARGGRWRLDQGDDD